MILSIVIPAFNAAPYLSECLDSILPQIENSAFHLDVEIIIVDDGSHDSTGQIADDFASKYPFIKVLHQQNGGLSNARNNGMNIASGLYVWFVDADDWITPDTIAEIIEILYNEQPEAVAIESCRVFGDGKTSPHFRFKDSNAFPISRGIHQLITDDMSCCVPFTIYSLSFLRDNNLLFYEGIFHEDTEFSPRAYSALKKLYKFKKVVYQVRQTPTSITRSVNFKKNFDILKVIESLNSFIEQTNLKHKWVISRRIARCFNASLLNIDKMDSKRKDSFFKELSKKSQLFRHYFFSRSAKYFVEGIVISITLKRYAKLYNRIYSNQK